MSREEKRNEMGNSSDGRKVCPVCMHHCALLEGQYGRAWARKNERQDYQCELRKSNIRNAGSDRKETVGPVLSGKQNLSVGSFGCNLFLPVLPES